MTKAERAPASANMLLASGDSEGACNRAYYAMFNAARAALLSANLGGETDISRSHTGLITAFSLYIIKRGLIPDQHGPALNRAAQLRQIADYRGDPIEDNQVELLIASAASFVEAIRTTFFSSAEQ